MTTDYVTDAGGIGGADDAPDLMVDVETLAEVVASPPEGTDLAEATGLLGVALLHRYDQDGDPDTLSAGISHLYDALALDPAHPDRVLWYELLSTGYGERARLTVGVEAVEAYDEALKWTSMALAGGPPDDPDYDPLTVALAEYSFDRFYALRGERERDEQIARVEAERLAGLLEPLTVGDPEAASYLRMLLGMAYLEQFGATEAREDLDRGISDLEEALWELPPDTARRAGAGAELVNAYLNRFGLTGDQRSVDRSVAVAANLVSEYEPGQDEWVMLHWHQAQAYESRWHSAAKDPADLDRAIASWQVVWDHDAEVSAALSRGMLLYERAYLTTPRAPEDLAEAAQAMEQALTTGELDDEVEVLLSVHWYRLLIMLGQTEQPEGAPDAGHRRRLVEQGRAVLDRAAAAPVDPRALLAGVLALGEFAVAHAELELFDRGQGRLALDGLPERVRGLLTLAGQLPDPPPEWQAVLDYAWGTLEASTPGAAGGAAEAAERFARAAGFFRTEPIGPKLGTLAAVLAHRHSNDTGDGRGSQAAARRIVQAGGSEDDGDMLVYGQLMSAFYHAQHGDLATFHQEVDRLVPAQGDQPPSRVSDLTIDSMVWFAQSVSAMLGKRPGPLAPAGAGPASLRADGLPPSQQLLRQLLEHLGGLAEATSRGDLSRLRQCAAEADELASRPMPDDSGHALGVPVDIVRLTAAMTAGQAHLQLARQDHWSRSPAERAVRWYEEAVALAGGHQHPLWATLAASLGESLRLAGSPDRARIRQLGMSALRGHAWQVLRQSGTEYALDAARNTATVDAYRLARWCLEDGATQELVAVLDATRGLVLNAATASRGIADQLAAQGHHELARQWRETAGLGLDRLTGEPLASEDDTQIPDDLRLRALQVLQPEVLDPIRLDDVRASLARLDADALVYLLPDRHGPAAAVVVPAAGGAARGVETIVLPDLATGPDSPLSQFAGATHGARDAGPAVPGSASLEDLCAWAWRVAMGPLVEHVQQWWLGRPAKVVLVPMDRLGLVPWHAASTSRGNGRRYAVEDLVLSYSPSARMMCRAARRPDRPIRTTLVVGNPSGDLAAAGAEARAIHRRFYPEGAYFGQPARDGEGTPEEVLAWIADTAPGPSLLHFACHGRVDADKPADAHLVLADGRRLAVRDLLDASRLAALEIDTVFLAACTTYVSGKDYDEVVSVATTFLAAGAWTVFGSLWRVPDEATSLLMYLVHHHLNVDHCTPAQALHRAQLWMIDPGRRPPEGMPEELARLCLRPDIADPVSWAAFTHLGR